MAPGRDHVPAKTLRPDRTGRRLVALTVSMVMLAGVLSAGATLWHTDKLNNSYHEAAEKELEERALAYAVTAGVFLDVLGPQAPEVLNGVLGQAITRSGQGDVTIPGTNEFYSSFLGFQVWTPDPTSPIGYRFLSGDTPEGEATPVVREEAIDTLVLQTAQGSAAAAVLHEEHREIHVSLPVDLGGEAPVIVVGTLSAKEELAFLESQRGNAFRDALVVSMVVIGFVMIIGIISSHIVARHLISRTQVEEALLF